VVAWGERVGLPRGQLREIRKRGESWNRLKQDQRTKLGLQNKRLKASWDERYLAELLVAPPHSTTGTGPSGPANITGI
jgi:hypothetical protein